MNENIDLTKILRGLEGIELWCCMCGACRLIAINGPLLCLKFTNKKGEIDYLYLFKDGTYNCCANGECVLFPSKDQRDWTKFQRPIPVDTPMMCSKFGDYVWILCYYSMFYNGKHRCFYKGCTSKNADANNKTGSEWSYMIPFDKFNPNDIEESLKYNIQK